MTLEEAWEGFKRATPRTSEFERRQQELAFIAGWKAKERDVRDAVVELYEESITNVPAQSD